MSRGCRICWRSYSTQVQLPRCAALVINAVPGTAANLPESTPDKVKFLQHECYKMPICYWVFLSPHRRGCVGTLFSLPASGMVPMQLLQRQRNWSGRAAPLTEACTTRCCKLASRYHARVHGFVKGLPTLPRCLWCQLWANPADCPQRVESHRIASARGNGTTLQIVDISSTISRRRSDRHTAWMPGMQRGRCVCFAGRRRRTVWIWVRPCGGHCWTARQVLLRLPGCRLYQHMLKLHDVAAHSVFGPTPASHCLNHGAAACSLGLSVT